MIRRVLVAALALALPGTTATAQAAPPNTEIYLAALSQKGDTIVVGSPRNVTMREGYDNQPSFTPDSRSILYTLQRDGQTDIWRYWIDQPRARQVTRTAESEYSAVVIPGSARISVIRVEADSTQRLWSFELNGSEPKLVLRDLKPVGYHAWLGEKRLAAFVLGTPSTLHLINADGTGDTIVARDIGRSLHAVPDMDNSYSWTQRDSARALQIMATMPGSADVSRLAAASPDNEYHAWTPDGRLLTTVAGVLQRWNGRSGAASRWEPVSDLAARAGVRNVSRLAVSPNGRWLAFVAEPLPAASR